LTEPLILLVNLVDSLVLLVNLVDSLVLVIKFILESLVMEFLIEVATPLTLAVMYGIVESTLGSNIFYLYKIVIWSSIKELG